MERTNTVHLVYNGALDISDEPLKTCAPARSQP